MIVVASPLMLPPTPPDPAAYAYTTAAAIANGIAAIAGGAIVDASRTSAAVDFAIIGKADRPVILPPGPPTPPAP